MQKKREQIISHVKMQGPLCIKAAQQCCTIIDRNVTCYRHSLGSISTVVFVIKAEKIRFRKWFLLCAV